MMPNPAVTSNPQGVPSPSSAPLLEIRGVSKSFHAVEALVDVDLVVHRREVVALVGDNAAGKSTLARIISGVYLPDEGCWMACRLRRRRQPPPISRALPRCSRN